jgi:hypothetical protein
LMVPVVMLTSFSSRSEPTTHGRLEKEPDDHAGDSQGGRVPPV